MTRRNVIPTVMFKYKRKEPESPYLGWGKIAVRKATADTFSERLRKFRSCIAGQMSGQTFANLKDVQERFKSVAKDCAAKVRG